jgi:hypothetical protein
MLSRTPALPDEPYVEIKKPWGMGECRDGMTLHGYSMLVDLVVKCFAQGDGVHGVIFGHGTLDMVWGKPKLEMIKKVKSRRINQAIRIRVIVGPEKDCRCENPLETLNNSPITTTIGGKTEEIEHLEGSFKVDGVTFLLHRESSYPNGNQPVLAEGQAIVGVRRNLQKELSVPSRMGQLTGWRAAERETAEDEGPCMESEFLFAMVALLACNVDRFELPEAALRNPEGRKTGPNCGRNGGQRSVSVRVSVDPVNRGIWCHSLMHRGRCKLLET